MKHKMVAKTIFSYKALKIQPPHKNKSLKREPTWIVVGVSNSYKLRNIILSFVS